jgi:fatty-acid peroxygenase
MKTARAERDTELDGVTSSALDAHWKKNEGQGERPIPSDGSLEASFALMRDGYSFISKRCARLGTDIFRTRMMLTPAICMRGAEAAKVFYGAQRFTRVGAMPMTTLLLLQDVGSVQLLDGAAHRRRKAMFMAMMTPEALERMPGLYREEWKAALLRWQKRRRVVLHYAVYEVLTRAAIRWAGMPLVERDVRLHTRELSAMIESAGSIGPANWWAQSLRRRSERWAQSIIAGARSGAIPMPPGSPLAIICEHTDADGNRLDDNVAAVELLNVVRPIVAVARFITFAALALHEHPQWRERFASGDEADLDGFEHEVRRFYPFFPMIGGRVVEPFSWLGYPFKKSDWVLLDLYGTNHDERLWPEPGRFRPERFRDWAGDPYTLIPQGGGAYETGHRCPGEWLTMGLIREAVRLLSRTRYDVPDQDLSISLRKMPALPASGFLIANVGGLSA